MIHEAANFAPLPNCIRFVTGTDVRVIEIMVHNLRRSIDIYLRLKFVYQALHLRPVGKLSLFGSENDFQASA